MLMDDGPFAQENAKNVSTNTLRNFFIIHSLFGTATVPLLEIGGPVKGHQSIKSLRPKQVPPEST